MSTATPIAPSPASAYDTKHMIISSARFYARITLNRPCQISGDLLSTKG